MESMYNNRDRRLLEFAYLFYIPNYINNRVIVIIYFF